MVSAKVLQLVLLAWMASVLPVRAEYTSYLATGPHGQKLQIGTNFTATCVILNSTEVTVDDLHWSLTLTPVPKELYTRINNTALNVTIPITKETPPWLFCTAMKDSPHVILNSGRYKHGILLEKGYLPVKPENLSCMAVQRDAVISPIMECEWEARQPQGGQFITTYKLFVQVVNFKTYSEKAKPGKSSAEVNMDTFPHFMSLDIWVEATNVLGTAESEHLFKDANSLVKTNPPSNVTVISERTFTRSLLINWTQPLSKVHLELTYEIRYCSNGCHNWEYVPPAEIDKNIHSFRLQGLQPYTVYIIQVRCKNYHPGYGYWSEWSSNATKITPEDRPTSKPDLWLIIEDESNEKRQVKLLSKEPKYANGRITRYEVKIQNLTEKDKSGGDQWETITPEAESSYAQFAVLKRIHVPDKTQSQVRVTALNSVGKSPEATLVIPKKSHTSPAVHDLKVYPDEGKLMVAWNSTDALEYVVEVSNDQQMNWHMDWQREGPSIRKTAIRGYLQEFVCYNVSVYPIYKRGAIGKPARVEAFLEQGAPLEGPSVTSSKPGCFTAYVEWTEIPKHKRRGFITHYKIFYSDGIEKRSVRVLGNITSCTLKSLSRNTRYDVWITASTINGSTDGFNHSFHTLKYAPGEIEGIVVGVSLGFLFMVILTMLLCICKKDVIKENFWPQIPNPGESTIGNWSPDYPLKAETPNESCLSGISVLDMDVCDGKSVFEEDKASLPLKKDKYLSEEHSSGIGGSSCMSSPRQSVSDSDEGGDMADTTASTVQYSSVVASSGYKGQTPGSQSQQAVFSRSESTQPLLESEENPDVLASDGSRQSQRYPRQTHFTASEGSADFNQLEMEEQNGLRSLDFCPLVEDSEHTMPTDGQSEAWPTAPASSYMPQLGGYRPQ